MQSRPDSWFAASQRQEHDVNETGCQLVQQKSRTVACTRGESFGCSRQGVWVSKGCRGVFRSMDGEEVECGNWRGWEPSYRCRFRSKAGVPPEDGRPLRAQKDHFYNGRKDISASLPHVPRVAVFLQLGYARLWKDMHECTVNVAEAAKQMDTEIDVYLTHFGDTLIPLQEFERIDGVGMFVGRVVPNHGADVGQFLFQLGLMKDLGKEYDFILKLHTKKDDIWRERAIESLCGTREQVHSALNNFAMGSEVDMLAPLGTTFGPKTAVSNIFPHIVEKYGWDQPSSGGPANAFDNETVNKMNQFYQILYPKSEKLSNHDLVIVAGTMFWVRVSAIPLPEILNRRIHNGMTDGYRSNGGAEHILERMFATNIKARGHLIKELPPAPKVIAMYFPQYHQFEENDRFWGKGFTEWTLLEPIKNNYTLKPLPVKEGGLGYYDLMDKGGFTRQQQGKLASAAGVHGFCFYHYWFSGSHAPDHHKVMYKVTEAMAAEDKPNVKFMLSWANEPWSRRWRGGASKSADNVVLLRQEYGSEDEWVKHFEYLIPFFNHPRYIKIRGEPVFALYRVGHIGGKLRPMITTWQKLAVEAGLPGLRIVNTLGNFYQTDVGTRQLLEQSGITSSFHFWPQLKAAFKPTSTTASIESFDIPTETQYWGAFSGFDRRPRDPEAKHPMLRSVEAFRNGLANSFSHMSQDVARKIDTNLFFVTAWNEWNEQAVLEPSVQHGFGYLKAVHENLITVPARSP